MQFVDLAARSCCLPVKSFKNRTRARHFKNSFYNRVSRPKTPGTLLRRHRRDLRASRVSPFAPAIRFFPSASWKKVPLQRSHGANKQKGTEATKGRDARRKKKKRNEMKGLTNRRWRGKEKKRGRERERSEIRVDKGYHKKER